MRFCRENRGFSSNKETESVTVTTDNGTIDKSIEASIQHCFRIQKSSSCCCYAILCHFSASMYELGGTLVPILVRTLVSCMNIYNSFILFNIFI